MLNILFASNKFSVQRHCHTILHRLHHNPATAVRSTGPLPAPSTTRPGHSHRRSLQEQQQEENAPQVPQLAANVQAHTLEDHPELEEREHLPCPLRARHSRVV